MPKPAGGFPSAPNSGVCNKPPFAIIPMALSTWICLVPGLGTSFPPRYMNVWSKDLSPINALPPGCLSTSIPVCIEGLGWLSDCILNLSIILPALLVENTPVVGELGWPCQILLISKEVITLGVSCRGVIFNLKGSYPLPLFNTLTWIICPESVSIIGYNNASTSGVPQPVTVRRGGSVVIYPDPPFVTFTARTPKISSNIGSITAPVPGTVLAIY